MNKKYQVFVSSTFRDLVEERQDTIRNILDLGHIPAGMELFPAADTEQLNYIKKIIDECDYYLLIVGARYGSLDEFGVSYTEREYDYAVETGKTVLAFIHGDPDSLPVNKADVSDRLREHLHTFRAKVSAGRLVRYWTDRSGLEAAVLKSLAKAFQEMPAVGWVRADTAASSDIIERSNRLLEENAILRAEIERYAAQLTPEIDNLAGLNDTMSIRFRWDPGKSMGYRDGSCDLTWAGIFNGVAAQLDVPKTARSIDAGIRLAISETGDRRRIVTLNDADKTRVKVQLVALGLIDATVSQTTQGGVAEFLTLSAAGKKTFMEQWATKQ